MSDDLIARAKERTEASPTPEEWGYRIALENGDHYLGRWRGDAVDENNSNGPIYLAWDQDGEPCYSRHYAALERELDAVRPLEIGTTVVIARGDNYRTKYDGPSDEPSGFTFGVVAEPNESPLPEADDQSADDGIPF